MKCVTSPRILPCQRDCDVFAAGQTGKNRAYLFRSPLQVTEGPTADRGGTAGETRRERAGRGGQ